MNHQLDVDKIFLFTKDPYKVSLKHLKDLKAFVEYPNDTKDVYKSIEEYSLDSKKKKIIFRKSKKFNKLLLIIILILNPKTLCSYTDNALQKTIF